MDKPEPGQSPPFEVFEKRPPQIYIDRVRAHVAATGQPETFPGIHLGPIDRGEPFRILSTISVPRDKRPEGDMAPCPRCNHPNKFYEGKLAWFPRLQAVAVVGHCCADSIELNAANAEFRERERLERAEAFLLDTLPKVPPIHRRARELRPAAAECQRVFDKFRSDGGRFRDAIRRACRGSGELTVAEILKSEAGGPAGMRTSGSSVQTVDVRFGRLAGEIMVRTKCSILADLDRALTSFRGLPGTGSEDDALDFVLRLGENALAIMADDVQAAIKAVDAVAEAIEQFRAFLAPPNLERITAWGAHPDVTVPMQASISDYEGGKGRKLFVVKGRGRRCGIVIEPELWSAPPSLAAAA